MLRSMTTLVVLFVTVVFLFGDPFKPLGYLLGIWNIPMPASLLGLAGASSVLAAIAIALLLRAAMPRELADDISPAACLLVAIFAGFLVLSATTNDHRLRAIAQLAPDQVFTRSLVASLRNVPEEFQFFLHGAAIKNCVPYAWSYSEMNFYELNADVAVNVLPQTWIEECGFVRTSLSP